MQMVSDFSSSSCTMSDHASFSATERGQQNDTGLSNEATSSSDGEASYQARSPAKKQKLYDASKAQEVTFVSVAAAAALATGRAPQKVDPKIITDPSRQGKVEQEWLRLLYNKPGDEKSPEFLSWLSWLLALTQSADSTASAASVTATENSSNKEYPHHRHLCHKPLQAREQEMSSSISNDGSSSSDTSNESSESVELNQWLQQERKKAEPVSASDNNGYSGCSSSNSETDSKPKLSSKQSEQQEI